MVRIWCEEKRENPARQQNKDVHDWKDSFLNYAHLFWQTQSLRFSELSCLQKAR